jgi:hypothetical protein
MPEFDVSVLAIRSGTHTVRVVGDGAAVVRTLVQSECDAGEHHCPPEWCSDDVESTVLEVKQVVPERALDGAGG